MDSTLSLSSRPYPDCDRLGAASPGVGTAFRVLLLASLPLLEAIERADLVFSL